jgi:hypothetical protein
MDEAVRQRVSTWARKYDADSLVICFICDALPEARETLRQEKATTIEGMIAGVRGDAVGCRSNATIGKEIGKSMSNALQMQRQLARIFIFCGAA